MAVLYRKYRPQKLADLVGQGHIKEALMRGLESGKISHAYLFCGPKGTGKTTTARILAKAVNCEDFRDKGDKFKTKGKFGEPCGKCDSCLAVADGLHMDLIEIDAASNRGIDDVRDLREKIKLSPVSSPFKVYIIDEAHSLTTDAFNALLKTLEEPPSHAIFILCTTESQKLPATIISRCSRFDFQRAAVAELVEHLSKILKAEKIEASGPVLEKIARFSDGSFRDGLSLLDQLSAGREKIDEEALSKIISTSDVFEIFEFLKFLKEGKKKEAILAVNKKAEEGADLKLFLAALVENLRLALLLAEGIGAEFTEEASESQKKELSDLAKTWTQREILEAIKIFGGAIPEIKSAVLPQLPLELAIVGLFPGEAKETEGMKGAEKGEEKADPVDKTEGKEQKVKESKQVLEEPSKVEVAEVTNQANLVRSSECKKVEDILKLWPQILTTVKGTHFTVEALLRGCRPKDFDGKVLTLEVFYKFHKERIEDPKVERVISQALSQTLGSDVMLKCILGEKGSFARNDEESSGTENSDDLAKAISEIFES